jgi:hypothetical protein
MKAARSSKVGGGGCRKLRARARAGDAQRDTLIHALKEIHAILGLRIAEAPGWRPLGALPTGLRSAEHRCKDVRRRTGCGRLSSVVLAIFIEACLWQQVVR